MRVFVTGATGFVGSHTTRLLLEQGHEVVALARSEAKARELFPRAAPRWVWGDLADEAALRRGLEGADVVVHLAGLTKAVRPAEFYEVNAAGTQRVLDAARAAAGDGVRMLHVSSLAAAGPTVRGRLGLESDPPHPISHYGSSKLAGEERVRAGDLPWTVVRPPAVYGPRDVEFLRLFRVVQRGWAPVFGSGDQELSLVYVEDLARALCACVELDFQGRTYYAAHPDVVTARELAGHIGRAVSVTRLRTLRIPKAVVRPALTVSGWCARLLGRATLMSGDKAPEITAEAWTCSSAALERDSGWRAEYDTDRGLAATASWYREQGWLVGNAESRTASHGGRDGSGER